MESSTTTLLDSLFGKSSANGKIETEPSSPSIPGSATKTTLESTTVIAPPVAGSPAVAPPVAAPPANAKENTDPAQGASTTLHAWKQYGFLQSKAHNANTIALDLELRKLLEQYKKNLHVDEKEQEELKTPLRSKLAALKIDVEKLNANIQRIRGQKIPDLETRKKEIKNEIAEIRRNPDHFTQKPGKLGIFLMGIILIFLTVYLWIFYTSASYSAFFRKFSADDINVANSIFDPRAISNAWQVGAPALVLVVTMPFIFLAMGFIMHKVLEGSGIKRYLALAALLIATFSFDYIIAYEIVKKIYDLQALNSLENTAPYSFRMAFSDINFWLIIFAGFVTYLIWGVLFEKFMTEYRKLDHSGEHIRVRNIEIADTEKDIAKLHTEAESLEKSMHEKEKDLAITETDLSAVFFRPKELEYLLYHFMSGWMQYIEGGLMATDANKDILRQETRNTVNRFLVAIRQPASAETA